MKKLLLRSSALFLSAAFLLGTGGQPTTGGGSATTSLPTLCGKSPDVLYIRLLSKAVTQKTQNALEEAGYTVNRVKISIRSQKLDNDTVNQDIDALLSGLTTTVTTSGDDLGKVELAGEKGSLADDCSFSITFKVSVNGLDGEGNKFKKRSSSTITMKAPRIALPRR